MSSRSRSDADLEQRLIEQARGGDLEAFNQIVDQYQGLVYHVCLRVIGDQGRAEDAAQDTFIRAYTSLDQYKGGSFKSWLTRIATNRCYDMIRSDRRRPASSLDAEPVETEPNWSVEPSSEDPDSFASRSQLSEYLEHALTELSDDQRVAVVLYDINGYTYEEITEITGATMGTVKSRISRGRRSLRDILRRDPHARELFESTKRQSDDETTHLGEHRSE